MINFIFMVQPNFECMLCDYKARVKEKGYHLGICKDCVRRIKVDWPVGKDVIITSTDKPVES